MDILTKERADIIFARCKSQGVELKVLNNHDPMDFISLVNAKNDMVSVFENRIVYEPALYVAPWSEQMIKWARSEGFSEETIKEQSLLRPVTLNEAVDYLCA